MYNSLINHLRYQIIDTALAIRKSEKNFEIEKTNTHYNLPHRRELKNRVCELVNNRGYKQEMIKNYSIFIGMYPIYT